MERNIESSTARIPGGTRLSLHEQEGLIWHLLELEWAAIQFDDALRNKQRLTFLTFIETLLEKRNPPWPPNEIP